MSSIGIEKDEVRSFSPLLGLLTATCIALTILFLGTMITNHLIAAEFNYDPILGHLYLNAFYAPYSWIWWSFQFGAQFPHITSTGFSGGLLSIVLATGAFVGIQYFFRSAKENKGLHGTANFASTCAIRAMGLIESQKEGDNSHAIYLGSLDTTKNSKRLCHRGSEHVLITAPTRSGKGISIILPTLLSWKDSAVIIDIKGELWALTSGWRKEAAHNRVLRLDFTDTSKTGARFNPLSEIRLATPYQTRDAQNLAHLLIETDGTRASSHWDRTAKNFLSGFLLYVLLEAKQQNQSCPSLYDVATQLSDPLRSFTQTLNDMVSKSYDEDEPRFIAKAARAMLDKPEKERGSVHSSTISHLELYKDPIIARNCAHSDFTIKDLMHSASPVSLYIVIPPSDLQRLIPLTRIVIDLIASRNMENMEFAQGRSKKVHKHTLLLMLDEFAALGRLTIFEKSLAYMAGFGMRAVIVTQSRSQLLQAYGNNESISGNCHIRVAFAPNEVLTARWLSDMLGKTTVAYENYQTSGKRGSLALNTVSSSLHHVARPLLLPDEVMKLPGAKKDSEGNVTLPGKVIIILAGHLPVVATQLLFFHDAIFSKRVQIKPPRTSDLLWDKAS